MQLFQSLINFILHIDKYLLQIVNQYGMASYAILFAIIFMETGLVVTPFLPGDSLLFAAGALSAQGAFSIWGLLILLVVAAFLGDTVNYWIGRFIGPKAFNSQSKFLKKEYLEKAQAFYEKHGGKTLIIARFMPIIRTFAPFVAGVGKMTYKKFLMFCIIGNVIWVNSFTFAGYFFGNIPMIKKNFSLVIFLIIIVSLLPTFYAIIKQFLDRKKKTA